MLFPKTCVHIRYIRSLPTQLALKNEIINILPQSNVHPNWLKKWTTRKSNFVVFHGMNAIAFWYAWEYQLCAVCVNLWTISGQFSGNLCAHQKSIAFIQTIIFFSIINRFFIWFGWMSLSYVYMYNISCLLVWLSWFCIYL